MGEFPRYYKTDPPRSLVKSIKERRFNPNSGEEEYLVLFNDAKFRKTTGPVWQSKQALMQDAVGPIYAERGGLFGTMYDTYGKSTYDRLRMRTSYEHSLTRLGLFENRTSRLAVGGITYTSGYPKAVDLGQVELDDDDSSSEASEVSQPEEEFRRARSKTPVKRKPHSS